MESKRSAKQHEGEAHRPLLPSSPPSSHRSSSSRSTPSRTAHSTYTRILFFLLAVVASIFLAYGSVRHRSREGGGGDVSSTLQGDLDVQMDAGKRRNNGLTSDVEWDDRSLFVKGQRLFIFSGEIHPWRLPVPGLWKDLTEKAKAAGFNAISIYVHWGLVNPKEGVMDWTGYRSLQPFFDYCRASGLFVVVRPGPHIQAEVSGGGIPGWVLEIDGELRTNSSSYTRAWTQYITEVSEIIRRNQVTEEGGVVIGVQVENEYYQRLAKDGRRGSPDGQMQWTKIAHMELLKSAFRKAGIVVPLTFNDVGFKTNFLDGPGSTDLYGWDGYPQGFDCSNPKEWYPLPTTWQYDHQRLDPDRPSYSPEFQGGAFDPWGGVGYEKCEELTGADFERVFYVDGLWAANAKRSSIYMLYGGTSWGQMPFPGVYTSYDYGAGIRENRQISSKFDELKRQGLFLRNVKDFAGTTFVANSTVDRSLSTSNDILTSHLRNFESGAGFYISRHLNSSSFDSTLFGLQIQTSRGSIFLDDLPLRGRDVRITSTDFKFGRTHLLFTTGQILVGTSVGEWDVLIIFAPKGERIALSLIDDHLDDPSTPSMFGDALKTKFERADGLLNVSAVVAQDSASPTVLSFGRRVILLADTVAAASYWQPTLASSNSSLSEFFSVGTNESVIVAGPHLVRSATINGSVVELVGDLNSTTTLLLIAPLFVTEISWNGLPLTSVVRNPWGALEASLVFSTKLPLVPKLVGWQFRDSLPEIDEDYDDSRWTLADHQTSRNPFKPSEGNSGSDILFANEYGFHQGNIIWRGRFESSLSNPVESIELEVASGWGGGLAVWLGKSYLGFLASYGSDFDSLKKVFNVSGLFEDGKEIILTVLQDHMGYLNDNDLGHGNDDFKKPRGIIGYKLSPPSSNFTSWKAQGNLGGESFVDRTRGIINEGGLFAERSGWHLPDFDSSGWEKRSPSEGLDAPGVGFFRTTFELSIPSTVDAPVSLVFSEDAALYRAQIYINGWQMGKLSSAVGPQHRLPLPQIVKNGTNTLAISLWSLGGEAKDLKIGSIWLEVDGVVEGGPGEIALDNPGWSPRDVF